MQGFLQKVGVYEGSHANKLHNDVGILTYPLTDRFVIQSSTKILCLNFACPVCLIPTLLASLYSPVIMSFQVVSSLIGTNILLFFKFMLPCIVIDFFLNNQQDALIIQIYSVIKLYMFRASSLPIIRSFLLYIRHW